MSKLKRIYIASALLLLAAIVCVTEFRFVTDNSEKFLSQIESIENGYNKKSKFEVLKLTKELNNKWEKASGPMDALLLHDYIMEIGININKLKIYISENDSASFYSTCEELKMQIKTLKSSEIPSFENII